MKVSVLTCAVLAFSLSSHAGDWGKAPVGKAPIDKMPIEECLDIGGEISAGYETDYIFNGVRYARDSVWADVNYTFDGLVAPITVGAWYLNGISGARNGVNLDELRLKANADLGSLAGFDVNLGYTHYIFPEFRTSVAPIGGYGEFSLGIRRNLGPVDLIFGTQYAMGGGGFAPSGWYHELGVEKGFLITDAVSLVFGAGVAYSDGYWGGSGWNHYYLNASLPIALNCRAVLTPYVGYVGGPDTWIVDGIVGANAPQSDILHGGVSLSVTF